MPTKKAAAAKARNKPGAVAPAGGASRARPKAKKGLDVDDDDDLSLDDERPPPPKKRTIAAPAALAKKQPPKAESGSDIEMADDPLPPKQKKASPTTKDLDSDSGDDLVRAALEKGKGKAAQAQSSKRKS
jgi:DNA topoisomerase-2